MRTIWIAIRGANYSGQAFKQLGKDVDEAVKKQQQMQQQARYMIFSGLLLVAMAGMVAVAFGKLIEKTSLGALYMADFGTAIEKLLTKVGEAIVQHWGPTIEGFLGWLDELAENETFQMIIGVTAIPLMLTIGVIGVSLLVIGMLKSFILQLMQIHSLWASGTISKYAAGGLKFVAPVTAILAITLLWVYAEDIGNWIEENIIKPLDKIKIDIKKQIQISAGEGDIFSQIINAIGQWLFPEGSYGSWTGKQQGTRSIPKTGPYYLHEGETVIPHAGSIGGIGVGSSGGGNVFDVKIDVSIGEVHSEADVEEVARIVGDKFAREIINRMG